MQSRSSCVPKPCPRTRGTWSQRHRRKTLCAKTLGSVRGEAAREKTRPREEAFRLRKQRLQPVTVATKQPAEGLVQGVPVRRLKPPVTGWSRCTWCERTRGLWESLQGQGCQASVRHRDFDSLNPQLSDKPLTLGFRTKQFPEVVASFSVATIQGMGSVLKWIASPPLC